MNKVIPFPGQDDVEAFRFVVFEDDGVQIGQFFEPDTPEWQELTERFDGLLDGPGCDQRTYANFENECRGIIKEQPLFLDAYAHIAMHYLPPHLLVPRLACT